MEARPYLRAVRGTRCRGPRPGAPYPAFVRVRGLAAVLACVVLFAAALALWPTPGAGRTLAVDPQPATPVLSPRRVPALLSRQVADTRLAGALDAALADPNLGAAR